MPRYWKSKILGILLIGFGLGVPIISLILLFVGHVSDAGESIQIGFTLLLLTVIPLWIVPIISGIYAFIAEAYKFVIFGTVVSLLYCIPLLSMSIKYGGDIILYWILLGICIAALIHILLSRDDFR